MDILNESNLINWDVLLCKKNIEEYLGYSHLRFYGKVSSSSKVRKDSQGLSSADDSRRHSSRSSSGGGSRRDSPSLSLGGSSSKRRHSHEAEGSSRRSGSKQRKVSPLIPSDVEEEDVEDEVPLAYKSSRHGANSGEHSSL